MNFDSLNYHVNEDIYKELKEQEMLKTSIDFSGVSEKLKSDYLVQWSICGGNKYQ